MQKLIMRIIKPGMVGLMIAISLVLSACSAAGSTQNATNPVPVTGSETVQVATHPQLGQILVTADGKTLYTNTVDTIDDLHCIDTECTDDWPPYTVSAEPTAGEGITGTLGTIARPDGSKQVTYNQQPLYTFAMDTQPGDANGEGFSDLGGTWHVVTLGGVPGASSTQSSSSTPSTQY